MELKWQTLPSSTTPQLTSDLPSAAAYLMQDWLADVRPPLRAAYGVTLLAAPETLFNFLGDPQQMCRYVPELVEVRLEGAAPTAVGGLRTCDYGNDVRLQERISLSCAPWLLGLETLAPNPFGLEQHATLISCAPTVAGTRLWWCHFFEHADLLAMLQLLNQTFSAILSHLIGRFGGHHLLLMQ